MKYIVVVILGALIASCSSSRFVEPLQRGETAVGVDLGGPMVKVPGIATIPIPFSSITVGKGISKKATVYGSWFTTAAIFGTAQFDVGGVYNLWYNADKKMGISTTPQINFAIDVFEKNFKLWPSLEANYYWRYKFRFQEQDDLLTNGSKVNYNSVYFGLGSWFELATTRAHDVKQTNFAVPLVHVGHIFRRKSWSFSTELKMIAPFSNNQKVVLDYVSLGGKYGATGVYFGVIKRF